MTTVASSTSVTVTIEGASYTLKDQPYTGAELRKIGGLQPKDKLVREEADGSETAIPPNQKVTPKEGDNFFVSVRFRRG